MLAQIAQRGFNFASNVSPTGTPLTGSFAARAAGAFSDVPGLLIEGTKNQREREQKIKLAALDAARADESENRKFMSQFMLAQMKAAKRGKPSVKLYEDSKTKKTVQQVVGQDENGDTVIYYTDLAGNVVTPTGQLFDVGTQREPDQPKAVVLYDMDKKAVVGSGLEQPNGRITDHSGNTLPSNIIPVTPTGELLGLGDTTKYPGLSSKTNQRTVFLGEKADAYLNNTLSPQERNIFRSLFAEEFNSATDAEGNVIFVPSPFAADMLKKDPSLALLVPGSKPMADGAPTTPSQDVGIATLGGAPATQGQGEPATLYTLSQGIGGTGAFRANMAGVPVLGEIIGDEELLKRRNDYALFTRKLLSGLNDNRAKSFSSTQDIREAIGNAQDPGILTTQATINAAVAAIDSAYARLIRETEAVVKNPTTSKTKREDAEAVLIKAREAREQIGYQSGTAEEQTMRQRAELERLRQKKEELLQQVGTGGL